MKIGILTFSAAENYGAILQAYSLQEFLNGYGHEVYMIDYRPDYLIDKTTSLFLCGKIKALKSWIRSVIVYPQKIKRKFNFKKFERNNLNLYKLDFEDSKNDFEAFVFGSDQIWNPLLTHGIDNVFLGNMPAFDKKLKISYAASCGDIKNLINYGNYCSYIANFNYIGVRENELKYFIEKHCNRDDAYVVLDPVLLNKKHVLQKFVSNKTSHNKYVLSFSLYNDGVVHEIARRIADEKNIILIEVISNGETIFDRSIKTSLSVNELLTYFWYAEYVVSSSFHGNALALLFNKDFTAVVTDRAKGVRIEELLSRFGLRSRIVYNLEEKADTSDINYESVENVLDEYREYSKSFLNNVLKDKNKIQNG